MKMIGIAELKSKLSEYLGQVKAGEEILVTERGIPIAKLTRVNSTDEHFAELVRNGIMAPGAGPISKDFFDLPRPKAEGTPLSEIVIEERRSGW